MAGNLLLLQVRGGAASFKPFDTSRRLQFISDFPCLLRLCSSSHLLDRLHTLLPSQSVCDWHSSSFDACCLALASVKFYPRPQPRLHTNLPFILAPVIPFKILLIRPSTAPFELSTESRFDCWERESGIFQGVALLNLHPSSSATTAVEYFTTLIHHRTSSPLHLYGFSRALNSSDHHQSKPEPPKSILPSPLPSRLALPNPSAPASFLSTPLVYIQSFENNNKDF